MDIGKIDERLNVASRIDDTGIVWRSAEEAPFRTYGVFRAEDGYRRVPSDVAEATSEKVAELAKNTSGGRIRFVTNSSRIAIRAYIQSICIMPHMAHAGIHGFDLYADGVFANTFMPPVDIKDGYESLYKFPSEGERLITINMPLYNGVYKLYIGLEEGATLKAAPNYKYECPVVFYGSSITQGGCASRPGTCYEAFLSRALDCNFVNLGFSGAGRAEEAIAEYMAGLDMSVFVMDYDYNAPNEEYLEATHGRLFKAIRSAQPKLPIIIISRPRYYLNEVEKRRREIIRRTYLSAKESGDENVYFIDGQTLMSPEIQNEGTVDNCHPTDLGFYSMASGILPVLRGVLEK